ARQLGGRRTIDCQPQLQLPSPTCIDTGATLGTFRRHDHFGQQGVTPAAHTLARRELTMAVKIAISGFGRIGRNVLRASAESKRSEVEVVAINDSGSPEDNAHLFKYDSVHGTYPGEVKVEGDHMDIGFGKPIRVLAIKDPTQLPWKDLDVDVVMECTGIFTAKEKAQLHLDAGAKRVLVSAPSKGADLTVVYGVNHDKLTFDHKVVSNASCTTNCLAPVAKVLNELCGIKSGFMTTVHA